MHNYWKIETHGDPIGAVRQVIQAVWEQVDLENLLVSGNGDSNARWIESPKFLDQINPFRPVMRENLARRIPKAVSERPKRRLGALLRPCEMRALLEMDRRQPVMDENLVTLCVDCLGTYPTEEFEWRAARKGSSDELGGEALQFARQGGILAYRYRPACQMCSSPGAQSADLNIHVLGLPAREKILVRGGDRRNGGFLNLAELSDGPADETLVQMHAHVLSRQAAFHHQTMERVLRALDDLLPKNLEAMITQLESCQGCQKCMAACPICSLEFPRRDENGHYPQETIGRWLISCAGCGMCEEACPNNLPLAVIFGAIREKLKAAVNPQDKPEWIH